MQIPVSAGCCLPACSLSGIYAFIFFNILKLLLFTCVVIEYALIIWRVELFYSIGVGRNSVSVV